MRAHNWLEAPFLGYYRNHFDDGLVEHRLKLFGRDMLPLTRDPEDGWSEGFYVSLMDTAWCWGEPAPDLHTDLRRYGSCRLLSRVTGPVKQPEEVLKVDHYHRDGFDYQIERRARWEHYQHFPWISLRGSKIVVFRVVSDDPQMFAHSFRSEIWKDGYEPSFPEILDGSIACQKIMADIGAGDDASS